MPSNAQVNDHETDRGEMLELQDRLVAEAP